MTTPTLSIVIPVYNEESGLATLFARLYPALDALGLALAAAVSEIHRYAPPVMR